MPHGFKKKKCLKIYVATKNGKNHDKEFYTSVQRLQITKIVIKNNLEKIFFFFFH